MTRFHFERPDGNPKTAQNILIHLNEFVPPQGYGGVAAAQQIMAYPINWLNSNYLQRIPFTINVGQVPSTQTDFPLLINENFLNLVGAFKEEIVFAGIDNIQLEHEIELFNRVTGRIVAWVKKPSVSDGDIIFMYFNNPVAIDEQDPGAVWADYNAVYHLNQTSFGALDTHDSTINNEDGTPQNMDATNQVEGKINGSLFFDGINEFIVMSNSSVLDPGTGGWTVFGWIRPDSNEVMDIVGKQRRSGSFDGWSLRLSQSGNDRRLLFVMRNSPLNNFTVRGTTQLELGVLHHVVVTYDGSDNASGVRMFINGIEEITNIENDTLVGGISTNVEFNIASAGGTIPITLLWKGIIDELNILNTEKTPDFITTVFNNQNDSDTFYSIGSAESRPPLISMGYPFTLTSMGYPK